MSEQTIPKKVRQRVRVRQNEGTISKAVNRRGQEPIEAVERFVGADCANPAYVSIGGRVTKNLGNYESVQVHVNVTLPCEPDDKSVRDTRAKASAMCDEFIDMELKEIGA